MSVEVVFNHFTRRIADGIEPAAEAWLAMVAFSVQAQAMDNTTRVDTGAMKDGWQIAPLAPGIYIVWNTQSYAIFHEFGTYKMAAAPMLIPAIETLRASLPGFWELVKV